MKRPDQRLAVIIAAFAVFMLMALPAASARSVSYDFKEVQPTHSITCDRDTGVCVKNYFRPTPPLR